MKGSELEEGWHKVLVKLSKYLLKKFWRHMFRPPCFNDPNGIFLNKCITKYYRYSTVDKRVLPCKHYYDCLEKSIEEQKREGRKKT